MIPTSHTGSSADLFPQILDLYVPDDAKIADLSYGKGVFWRNVDKWKYDLWFSDLAFGVDARNIPFYQDDFFDCLVWDPPFMHDSATVHRSLQNRYANRDCAATKVGGHKAVLQLYLDAAREAHRVLKPNGIYIVKCQDEICSGKQCWTHNELLNQIPAMGFLDVDLFILTRTNLPILRQKKQRHARKNHSYFLVFRKRRSGAHPA